MYYLDGEESSQVYSGLAHVMSEHQRATNKEEIWLWHKRLGHPSFGYLKQLFPSLFNDCKPLDLICETCVMAKSHRAVFPSSSNKVATPFSLIHFDVWGPAPVTTPNGMKWFVTFVDDCTRIT